MSSEKIIVLYERLSREDENLGESYSISNQKNLMIFVRAMVLIPDT